MPGFSKDTMRTTLCTLIFLCSLPRSLNGHLTSSYKNNAVTNTVENTSEARNYTIDSETKNVVSFSRSDQTQHLTSHSEQQGFRLRLPNGEDETSRTKRNVRDNFTTTSTHPNTQMQDELSRQKELLKPTESSHRPHNTSRLQTENATEFNATRADVLPEGKTTSGLSDMKQEATQETPSTSETGLYGAHENGTVMDSNNTNTNKDSQTVQPTIETSNQPSPMSHAHISALATVTNDTNWTVNTNGVKTTESNGVTDKWTSTQRPEFETPSSTKPTKTLSITEKTTAKRSPPLSKDKQQTNPGPAVAGVIGTTFFLMFIAIILILVRKRKMQRKQLENPEWAGPSPFLDVNVQPNLPNMDEPETINRQGFNQMSISRYLSQRLSKHLTFGRNTNDEVLMGDILQGSTFGRQNPDEVQAPNGNPTAAQNSTEMEENTYQKGQASVDSTKTPTSENEQEPVTESKESKQTDDFALSSSSGPDTVIKPPSHLVSIDLDSLSEEPASLQTSDGWIVPPAPTLP